MCQLQRLIKCHELLRLLCCRVVVLSYKLFVLALGRLHCCFEVVPSIAKCLDSVNVEAVFTHANSILANFLATNMHLLIGLLAVELYSLLQFFLVVCWGWAEFLVLLRTNFQVESILNGGELAFG